MNPYIGEVRLFAGPSAPPSWMLCQGQLLSISEHSDLFNVIGTIYGGDGIDTFGLPDLRGRVPIHNGAQPGGPTYAIGQAGGTEAETLQPDHLPRHTHKIKCATNAATGSFSKGNYLATARDPARLYYQGSGDTIMNVNTIAPVGGNPHNNMQPFLCINYIICLEGLFPPS